MPVKISLTQLKQQTEKTVTAEANLTKEEDEKNNSNDQMPKGKFFPLSEYEGEPSFPQVLTKIKTVWSKIIQVLIINKLMTKYANCSSSCSYNYK